MADERHPGPRPLDAVPRAASCVWGLPSGGRYQHSCSWAETELQDAPSPFQKTPKATAPLTWEDPTDRKAEPNRSVRLAKG